jgi:hypothetical protein
MGIVYVILPGNIYLEITMNLQRGEKCFKRNLLSGSIEKWRVEHWLKVLIAIRGFYVYQNN